MPLKTPGPVLVLLALATMAPGAAGQESAPGLRAPDRVFLNLGRSSRDATVAGAGLRWESRWRSQRLGGEFSGAFDVSLTHWSAISQGRQAYGQLSLVPLLRWRPFDGESAWFVEAGIGASFHHRHYEVGEVRMGSRWNFHDVLALGRTFGPDGRREWSLRAVHVSNAGIRRPNPGEDLIVLRWSYRY